MFGAPRRGRVGIGLAASSAALLVAACSGRTEIFPNDGENGSGTRHLDAGTQPPDASAPAKAGCPSPSVLCGAVCVDVSYDPRNCGTCGTTCAIGEVCSAGACGTTCLGGSVECGERCVDLDDDPANCGACGDACAAGSICSRGVCTLGCSGGTTECGGVCADLQNDTTNCGACGAVCGPGEYCAAGQCASACPAPFQPCNGTCTDTTNDPNHCGTCDTVCQSGLVCSNGACSLECGGGTTQCNGACVVTASDPSNCGGCGNACGSTEHCANGICVACPASETQCNGVCVDLESNAANCGACSKACPGAYYGTTACQNGACTGICYSGYGTCAGTPYACQTNLNADVTNCGVCGNACAAAQACTQGVCTSCVSGNTVCSGVCVDTTSNVSNCGACGASCPYRSGATPSCVSGVCESACVQGYADCDLEPTNGCEASLQTDRKNCGACGHACAAGAVCTQGTCTACAPGRSVCGTACTDFTSDASNCGACGVSCGYSSSHAVDTCQNGACALSCSAGYLDCDGNALDGCETTSSATHCGSCKTSCATGQFCAVSKCATCNPTSLGQTVPVTISGTTVGASDSFVTSCGQPGEGDTYFSFTAPAARNYTVTLTANTAQIVEVRNGSCGGAALSCSYYTTPQSVSLQANQTVIIVVETYYATGGPFTLTVQ